ncbi:YmaF family protein [Aquibacillus sp. 3ASR75-11]|uniref:YmaF family protein n=1 Tax=Terrihalobacillus insolitus TaxID=2950438 RepID=A0A9X3WQN0_9BACI|nr:YmaF family protein [Terrihalobacillus insolitus]MDC3414022.1 YmaF family protein [Terrihalobacillus insolitus]MDC3424112.1 YmaF family protein [Terrihalobacillus insolitus]
MQYRSVHPQYYSSFPAPDPFVNGTGYPHLSNPETVGTDHHFRKETQMNLNPNEKTGHTHGHNGATTCNDEHVHMHPGVTSTPIETKEGHIHKVWGNTTFDDGHIHYYEAYTGPPIPLPNGYHTHYAEIKTTEADGHIHMIKGFTKPSQS